MPNALVSCKEDIEYERFCDAGAGLDGVFPPSPHVIIVHTQPTYPGYLSKRVPVPDYTCPWKRDLAIIIMSFE